MSRELRKIVMTAGDRFAVEAMRLAQRRYPAIGWLAPLRLKMEQAASRPTAADGRFERREMAVRPPAAPPRPDAVPVASWAPEPRQARAAPPAVAVQLVRPKAETVQAREIDVVRRAPQPEPADRPVRPGMADGNDAPPEVHAAAAPVRADYLGPSLAEIIVRDIAEARPEPGRRDSTQLQVEPFRPAPVKPAPEAAASADAQRIEAGGEPLPAQTRERLRAVVGPEVAAMRIHRGGHADAVARDHHAAAVTIGHEVFFRNRAYRPDEPSGMALLAHEATHVVEALSPGASWRRATDGGVRQEEALAGGRERAMLGAANDQPRPALRQPAPSREAALSPQKRPMAADFDRFGNGSGAAPEQRGPDMEELRRVLFRDLMARIKVEFERGA